MITGAQMAAYQKALLSAFPSRQKLKEMVRIRLGENLDQMAGGKDLAAVVFNLIEWADSNGKAEELLIAGFHHNQGNEELKRVFAERFGFTSNKTRTQLSIQMAMLYNFDLDDQINECLNALWRKQGLVGFAIARSSVAFRQNLCERLKYELGGQDYVHLMPPLTVTPFYSPISDVILTVEKRCIPALKKRDVLLTVQVSKEEIANRFWQSLRHAVERHNLKNRLIVVVVTEPDCPLPEEVTPLTPPHFQVAHVYRWVRQIVSHFDWPESLFRSWTVQMINECSHEERLQIEWVYDYLTYILQLLKQNPTASQLQLELEKRKQIYA